MTLATDLNERSPGLSTKPPWQHALASPLTLRIAAAVLAGAIFAADTVTDLEIAVAVFYVTVVLLSVTFAQKRGVMLIAGGCMVLTVVSYLLTPMGDPIQA